MLEEYENMELKEIYEKLNSSENGLSNEEANERLKNYGRNALPKQKKDTVFKIFIRQFNSPIIFILIIAIILSLIIGEYFDAIFIILVLLIDIFLGTYQEWRAERSADSLNKLIKEESVVLRGGKLINIDSEEIVIGDIIHLESGERVTADLRLIETNNLTIDEAILTGESITVDKNALSTDSAKFKAYMAYAGTTVIRGRAKGIVINTGVNTEIGKIAKSVHETEETKSPLVIRMEKFTKQISYMIAIIALVLSIVLYFKNYMVKEIFFTVIALSISAIPEGLPIVLTVALTIATNRMYKKNVLVKKLNSVESLGSCTVIASDKTGTMTLNEQTAKLILFPNSDRVNVTGIGYNGNGKLENKNDSTDFLIELSSVNSDATLEKVENSWEYSGDLIDVAIQALAIKNNTDIKKLRKEIISTIPYESELKYSAALVKNENKKLITIKGSIEKILEYCTHVKMNNQIIEINKDELIRQNKELAEDGYRVIAVAYKETDNNSLTEKDLNNMIFIGVIAFVDPIRTEVISAIETAHHAGIKISMITGDHPLTAYTIAKEIGLTDNYDSVANVEEIDKYLNYGLEKFDEFVSSKKVFSRVSPQQKLEIVESYKRQGEFVAVTGDGVNDAPALKSANIGVAMGSGTDVAKETSAMIVTDDNFLSIVSGIEEGRIAYSNIRKVIYMLLSCGVAEVLFFVIAILFDLPIPLIAIQLLWLNLVTDGIQDIALAYEAGEEGIMDLPPRRPDEKIFNKPLIEQILLAGITTGLIVFGVWIYLINVLNFEISYARGYILMLMVFMQNMHVLNCRSESKSLFKMPFRNNPFIVIAIVFTIILQVIVTNGGFLNQFLKVSTIPLKHILILFLLALPVLIIMEIYKKVKKHH